MNLYESNRYIFTLNELKKEKRNVNDLFIMYDVWNCNHMEINLNIMNWCEFIYTNHMCM